MKILDLHNFFEEQLATWPEARRNYERLSEVVTAKVDCGDYHILIQHNPARIRSTNASVEAEAIKKRPCFLCEKNRPKEQLYISVEGGYQICVNPYPICREHFTVVASEHTPQSIRGRVGDMLRLARLSPGYTIFYNGPYSGASAPDHFHFQMIPRGILPLEGDCLSPRLVQRFDLLDESLYPLIMRNDAMKRSVKGEIFSLPGYMQNVLIYRGEAQEHVKAIVEGLIEKMRCNEGESEPRLNLIAWYDKNCYTVALIPRRAHRPVEFYYKGEQQILFSPGAVDMAGLIIAPRLEDFERYRNVELLKRLFAQVSCSYSDAIGQEPKIEVGIMYGARIRFRLRGTFHIGGTHHIGETLRPFTAPLKGEGEHIAEINPAKPGTFLLDGVETPLPFTLEPKFPSRGTFELIDVTIGINFHWQRKQNQRFRGSLKFIEEDGHLTAINILPLEEYIESVISSEMSPHSPLALMKAHAVISRSWLIAQLTKSERSLQKDKSESVCCEEKGGKEKGGNFESACGERKDESGEEEIIKWWDRENHKNFDVCADDHCQRYQGISDTLSSVAKKAVRATRGEVILYNGDVCDARFSKCCGGVTEEFESAWEENHHPYLTSILDEENDTTSTINVASSASTPGSTPAPSTGSAPSNASAPSTAPATNSTATATAPGSLDLTIESNAEAWIKSSDRASLCNTHDKRILSTVLKDYDQETTDFYRWQVSYSTKELSELITQKSGIDFGTIRELIPVKRGPSGRIIKLKIVGTKSTKVVGKELYIRQLLSPTHLYSSAFVVEHKGDRFTLYGAGWGHGVGLCQIGAAVMAERGYGYREIISHYLPGTIHSKIYD